MKKTDVAMIVLIASTSVLISYFSARAIFGDVYNGRTTVKTIESISSEVEQPSADIFNQNAIDPAVQIGIKDTTK
ncbi:hypothetical protein HGB24_00780 [Candidatus Saccharibacteria bacterium]|nr:hypothetical protein [Candidatus Saccharibacteria bacterium]